VIADIFKKSKSLEQKTDRTRELKTVHSCMMPAPLHLSDVRCKCFLHNGVAVASKKTREQTDK